MWTRNTSGYSAWQRHMVTGHEPSPQHAQALTVVDDKAYMLVLKDEHLEVHELNLQTWHWQRLQQRPMLFSKTAKDTIAAALVEVCSSTCPTCYCVLTVHLQALFTSSKLCHAMLQRPSSVKGGQVCQKRAFELCWSCQQRWLRSTALLYGCSGCRVDGGWFTEGLTRLASMGTAAR